MRRIIWTCWLQGRGHAPPLVQACLQSWEVLNPGWEFRCLDATTIGRYIDLTDHIDLSRCQITAASLSDIIRILLLHEYGGVWVDATLFCNHPLDTWLPAASPSGFFAFSKPAPDRLLSSWFIACRPGHPLIAKWAARVAAYWASRQTSDDYFWFHHLFGSLYKTDAQSRTAWDQVPAISADASHALLATGAFNPATPVIKLSHRLDVQASQPGSPLRKLLGRFPPAAAASPTPATPTPATPGPPTNFAGLKTSTENFGDHIQILAAEILLKRAGITIHNRIDRDDEIASRNIPPGTGIVLNGWFKTNPAEWPPHPNLTPLYLGFHIRLFQAPSLIANAALENYRQHGPIGCRDDYTFSLLRARGVDAFLSNCLSLTLPRRLPDATQQTEIFAVSRDQRILSHIPESLGPISFINHYSGSTDFDANLQQATALLRQYRTRARLIITTLLHCALPAIAMGIPVIVFYPINPEPQHNSDLERFSTLARMLKIHHLSEAANINWQGQCIDVSETKLALIERFFDLSRRWALPPPAALGPIAPAEILPVPSPEQLARVVRALESG